MEHTIERSLNERAAHPDGPAVRPYQSAEITDLSVSAYTIPTETPEADGTYEWDSTTIVVVEVTGGGKHGLGYTYADTATAKRSEEHTSELQSHSDLVCR